MKPVPPLTMRPGYTIPRLIRGGWQLSGDHGAVDRTRAIEDVVAFVDAGIACFDCADIYTGVEELYGEALQKLANVRGQQVADSVRIHTKYVPDRASLGHLSAADTRRIITRSLGRLRRERLDLVQFHWWDYDAPGLEDTVGHLTDLKNEGLITHIGITNFGRAKMEAIAGAVDLVSAQIQFSLMDRRAALGFAESAKGRNVHLICYGVLAGGFLTDAWLGQPDPGFQFENRSLIKYRLIIDEFGGWDAFQTLLQTLRTVANRHDGDIAAVAVRAMLEDPDAAALIVGARYARHLPRLKKALEFTLTDEDHQQISAIQAGAPGPTGDVYALERDATGPHGSIMKYNLNDGVPA
jgi:aryl-alcohol dehydrogenase-like predicted oxidoreductase